MAKTKISEYDSTAANNTDIDGINIDEGCAPSGINNAIREVMAHLKDFQAGTSGDTLPVASGGTGATTATNARTNLGLGSISTQAANSVAITGGSITGITDLAVADGGTGASDAAGARTNLGLGTMSTQNATSVNIDGGAIDGTPIGANSASTGAFTTATATTVDTTNLEATNIKAKDGTAAATIADSTGVITVSTELNVDNININGNTVSSTDTNGNIILDPNGTGYVQEDVGGTDYNLVSQYDIGTEPNEIPLNQYLGNLAYQNSDQVVLNPVASAVPSGIGDMVFQLTSDTSLEIKVKGSDGTVRSVALTLA